MAKPKSRSGRPSAAPGRPAKTAARNVDGGSTASGGGAGVPGRPARPSAKDAAAKAVSKPPTKAEPKPVAAKAADEKKASGSAPRSRPAPTKRTTPPASGRYTPPIPRAEKVSPVWVPILMFTCLGLGMLTIILNYVNVLPGPNPSNAYLMVGLVLITIGFVTATKYH